MYNKHTKDKLMGLIVACSALTMSQTADATVVNAKSEGYAAYIDLNLLDLADIVLQPIPGGAHGEAPAPYHNTDSTLSLEIPNILKLDVLWGEASSDVDGSDGSKTTSGFGEVAGLNLDLFGLVTLDLGVINASASVTGDYGTMSAMGSTAIALASGTILGIPVAVDVSPTAEINLLGISIIFDEQMENCTDSFCSMEANAIHINFDDLVLNDITAALLGIDTLTGEIIIGHAYAEMSAAEAAPPVPVPAAAWLFGSGIMGLVGFARRRQAQLLA